MNPALLLDPKGSRKRETQNQTRIIPQYQPTFDSRALLNPKVPPKRPAADADISTEERGREGSSVGQSTLLDRLHNVHHRTASPAKRVKTEEERRKSKAPTSTAGSGALDLNSQHNIRQVPPPLSAASANGAIDLTMSDDEHEEDVKVMKDNSNEVICLGRMKNVYIQCHVMPMPDPSKYTGNFGHLSRMIVRFRRAPGNDENNMIMVVDPSGREFGRVDGITSKGLAPLMDSSRTTGLLWSAQTEPRRRRPDEGPPGSQSSALINVTLQLYSPRKVATQIGKFLYSKRLLLEDPIFDLQKYDYYNPQTSNSFNRGDATQPTFSTQSLGAPRYATGNVIVRSVEEVRSDVQNMFDLITDDVPEREQPSAIKTPLMKHQKQALYFMHEHEQLKQSDDEGKSKHSVYRTKYDKHGQKYFVHVITGASYSTKPPEPQGGLLADEMGLGKTLSIFSLVADSDSISDAQVFAQKAPPMSPQGLREQIINSRATLLICPLSTRYNWESQIKEHFKDKNFLSVCNYYGPERSKMTVNSLANHDFVITTYETVTMDVEDPKKPLQKINWFRIVLDEAHSIRNHTTRKSMMTCKLAAQRRWAVTGTPVQNRLEDLGSLFKFLRLHPFDTFKSFNEWIINPFKAAEEDIIPKLQLLVSSITLRRTKNKGLIDLPDRKDEVVRLKFSKEEQKLHDWFEQDSQRRVNAVTSGEKLGGNAYARILQAIMNLRLICAHGRDLLSDDALKLTDGMTYDNPMEIEGDEEEAPKLGRAAAYDMLNLLNQTDTARCQYCRKPILEMDEDDDIDSGDEQAAARSRAKNTIGYMTPCYHIICPKDYSHLKAEWDQIQGPDGFVICNFCDSRVRNDTFELMRNDYDNFQAERERIKKDPRLAKKIGGYTGPHTKTKALLEELRMSAEESELNQSEPPIKSVVFSSWTTHLDLIQIALETHGHVYTRLDGRMDGKNRNRALEAFANDPKVRVMLISIGAGGLGLNLTTANKVYVMEPQFNPAAEAQAVDRVHRLGQKRTVFIKRYIMENSFEEKMLELQRKKKALADMTMARERTTKEQDARQRLEELRSLFR